MNSLHSQPSMDFQGVPPRRRVMRSRTADGLPYVPPTDEARPPPRRAKTYDEGAAPWHHMAQTYTWVVEQESAKFDSKNGKCEQWILKEHIIFTEERDAAKERPAPGSGPGAHPRGKVSEELRQRMWEELMREYETEAHRWMRREEEERRRAAERERERRRVVQEEIRRVQSRIFMKRESERQKIVQERQRAFREWQDRQKREQERADKAVIDAWGNYQTRWAGLLSSKEPLTFESIPWPMLSTPMGADGITPAAMVLFLFSPLHSQSQGRKERIKRALLRWHPDRFTKILERVAEGDRAKVEEGVGAVARCLNDLMAREANVAPLK